MTEICDHKVSSSVFNNDRNKRVCHFYENSEIKKYNVKLNSYEPMLVLPTRQCMLGSRRA